MVQLVQVTAWGEEHGLISTLPNAVPFDDFKNIDPANKEKMRKQKKEDERMVKVRYINHEEGSQGRFRQPYVKYAGEPIQMYNLIHDYEYTLPLGFVNEINEMKAVEREGLQSVDGRDISNDGAPLKKDRFKRVHECFPIGFK